MNNNKNTIKTISKNEKKISTFHGSSVRKWADAVRKSGKLPKVYYYLATEPIRDENGTRVLVEGKSRASGVLVAISRGGPLTSRNLSPGSASSCPCLERKNGVRSSLRSIGRPFHRRASTLRSLRRGRSDQYARMAGGWGVYAGAVSIRALTVPCALSVLRPSRAHMMRALSARVRIFV